MKMPLHNNVPLSLQRKPSKIGGNRIRDNNGIFKKEGEKS